jgi:hypothetical protein
MVSRIQRVLRVDKCGRQDTILSGYSRGREDNIVVDYN